MEKGLRDEVAPNLASVLFKQTEQPQAAITASTDWHVPARR